VLNAQRIELALEGDRVWRGAAEDIVIRPGQDVVAERFLLASGHQRLEAHGTWNFHGPDEIRAELQSFDLAGLHALLGDMAFGVDGVADAHLVLEGDIENPEIVLEGALRGTSIQGVDDVNLVYVFTYRDGRLALDAQADLQERGTLMMTSSGIIDPDEIDLTSALENGVYEVDLAIADLALSVVDRLAEGALPDLGGVVGGRITASGPIQAPSFEGTLHVPDMGLEGWTQLTMHTDFSYENGVLGGRVVSSDEHGDLAEAEVSLLLDLVNLVNHPEQAMAVLEVAPWRISLRTPTRLLGSLPGPCGMGSPRTCTRCASPPAARCRAAACARRVTWWHSSNGAIRSSYVHVAATPIRGPP
jgi:autotransporter translocation and assembly factor TamB